MRLPRPISEGWALLAPLGLAALALRRRRRARLGVLAAAAAVVASLRDPERPSTTGPHLQDRGQLCQSGSLDLNDIYGTAAQHDHRGGASTNAQNHIKIP